MSTWWDITSEVLKYISGGAGGAIITALVTKKRNVIQKMDCLYEGDEILSKIPVKNADNTVDNNLYIKRFTVVNTTNLDIDYCQIRFQFDVDSEIKDCYSQSKEGFNYQKVQKHNQNHNEAIAKIKKFNRKDRITIFFRVANISDNMYYVTESSSKGFKIRCKDKSVKKEINTSKRSSTILVTQ